jgi:hypothetical protein
MVRLPVYTISIGENVAALVVLLGFVVTLQALARISQCAPTARITSGGGFHPDSCRFDLVAGKRSGGVTGRAEALRQRPPWAVEQSDGP